MQPKHQIEQEIKLTAPDQATLDRLWESDLIANAMHDEDSTSHSQMFSAIYYDTPDWHLRELRWSLRTRDEGDRHVSTLKRNNEIINGVSSCEEMEQLVEHSFECVTDIPAGKIADAMQTLFPEPTPLLPRVNVDMLRSKRMLKVGQSMLEFVTDAGKISANGHQCNLYEVELELLNGDLHAPQTQQFVDELSEQFSLRESHASKHAIGLSLYGT